MSVQLQAQADRDACDRLLKAIFDRGLGQRQIARVTGMPLSTVQRALQRVIYPYRQDRPIEDAPTWKKRRAKLESRQCEAMSYYRTPEHRARQSAAIQQWRPWEHSTGPKSEEGKVRVSRNPYKGGTRAMLRKLARLLREQYEALKRIG